MEEDDYGQEGFDQVDLDNLIIKDKEYTKKIWIKRIILFSFIFFAILIIAAIIIIIIVIKNMTYGKIECIYQTLTNNETITLINWHDEDKTFFLLIDEEEFEQKTNHTYKNPGLHKVIFVFKKRLKSLAHLFSENEALIEADLSQLESKELISLKGSFTKCLNLKKVKFEFAGSNKIEDMSNLFTNCSSLNSVIFNFKAEKVVDMREMFYYCFSIKSLNINLFNTKNLKYMDQIFSNCVNLTFIDLSDLNFKQLISMKYTFEKCEQLIDIKFLLLLL